MDAKIPNVGRPSGAGPPREFARQRACPYVSRADDGAAAASIGGPSPPPSRLAEVAAHTHEVHAGPWGHQPALGGARFPPRRVLPLPRAAGGGAAATKYEGGLGASATDMD